MSVLSALTRGAAHRIPWAVSRSLHFRAIATLLAVVVAVATGTATLRVLWCAPMQQALLTCCCPAQPTSEDALRRTCCEAQDRAQLPDTTSPDASQPIFVAFVAVVPASQVLASIEARFVPSRADVRARAGPAARVHAQTSVYLL